jgi:hypothetical protein
VEAAATGMLRQLLGLRPLNPNTTNPCNQTNNRPLKQLVVTLAACRLTMFVEITMHTHQTLMQQTRTENYQGKASISCGRRATCI